LKGYGIGRTRRSVIVAASLTLLMTTSLTLLTTTSLTLLMTTALHATTTASTALLPASTASTALLPVSTATMARLPWGFNGHTIAGRAAATRLPAELPRFFREATAQLTYLNPEPDRWRGDGFRELNEAKRYDHYIDFEIIPQAALEAQDRFRYLSLLQAAGVEHPARDAGLLPWRIIELYQNLVVQWRLWHTQPDATVRAFIEQRIINDAGILGHYVMDGSNPHHTSVHHDGWRTDYPNPRGFTTERGFHSRFESRFVEANVKLDDLLPHIRSAPRRLHDVRADVLLHLQGAHGRLERLYELDQVEAFGPGTRNPAHKEFAVERLAAGSNMLRDLWWSAWLESAPPQPAAR
jgi:hypothetical protein